MNFLVSGTAPRRMGNAHPNLVPYQVFRVSDGELVIAVGSDAQFRLLVEVLGMPGLADEPFARTNADRVQQSRTGDIGMSAGGLPALDPRGAGAKAQ